MKTLLSFCNVVLVYQVVAFQWRAFVVIFLIQWSLSAVTQAQNIIWDKTYGGNSTDYFLSTITVSQKSEGELIQQTADGGFIVGGSSYSKKSGDKTEVSKGGADFWIIKLNPDGSKAWDKTIGGNRDDFLASLQQTSDGGYILGGVSMSGISGDKSEKFNGGNSWGDYWVVKLRADGSKVWDKTLGGTNEDFLAIVQQTPEGGYILGGWSDSKASADKTEGSKGGQDYWIVKLNPDGSKAWDKTLGGDSRDHFVSLQQTSDKGYILGGWSYSGVSADKTAASKGGNDYWVIKLKADGTKDWDKTYGGQKNDELATVKQTRDGNYMLSGSSYSENNGDKSEANKGRCGNGYCSSDYWIIKIKPDGSKIWDKSLGGDNEDVLASLQQTTDGGYILGGYSGSNIGGDKSEAPKGGTDYFLDYWVVKLKADGSKVWDKTLGGKNARNALVTLQQTNDGNFIMVGSSTADKSGDKSQNSRGGEDYWIVKLDNSDRNIPQIVNFEPIAYKNKSDEPFALSATATSGLPITFKVESGPATVKGNKVTLTGSGKVTIKAYQAGNATYLPAEATRTFLVRDDIQKYWDKTFGGTNLDKLTTMAATPDGGYLLGGFSASGVSGNKSTVNKGKEDYWLVKTDKQGNKSWDKAFGGSGTDHLTVIVATADGGYLLGGSSDSNRSTDKTQASKGNTDYWLIKIDATGNKLWDKVYGGNGADNLTTILATGHGQYLLGGSSESGQSGDKSQAGNGKKDYWLVLIDEMGTKIWDQTYGGNNADNLAAIIATTNGDYLVGGSSESGKSGDKSQAARGLEDYWVLRLKADGTKLWDKTFGGTTEAIAFEDCFEEDPEDCYYLSGRSVLSSLAATPDGGFLLGGSSNAAKGAEKSEDNLGSYWYDSDITDYWVVKINESGDKIWDNSYNGVSEMHDNGQTWFFITGNSTLKSIIATGDGHYILAGTSNADKGADKIQDSQFENVFSSERDDYWVIKIDESGTKRKDWVFGGFSNDYLMAIVPESEGGYVLGGNSASGIGGDKSEASWDTSDDFESRSDYWIVKIKDETSVSAQWNMRYGGSDTDNFTSVIKTSDGGYLIGGYSASSNSGDKSQSSQGKNDYWIVKSDKNGKKLWDKRYGGSQDDYLNRVIQTQDGGYLLAGSSLSGQSGDKTQASQGKRDYWVVKLDKLGNKQWDRTFGGSGSDELKKVVQLASGEYVLGGYSNSPVSGDKAQASQGGTDYWILKISKNGTLLWDRRYGGAQDETLGSFSVLPDGGLLLGGSSASGVSGDKTQPSQGGKDFWVVRIDSKGNIIWDKRFGGTGEEELYSMGMNQFESEQATYAGDYFVGGTSTSGISGNKTQASQGGKDFWMVQLHSNGNLVRDLGYGGNQDEELRSVIQTQNGDYLLAGSSYSGQSGDKSHASKGLSDYWVLRIDAFGNKQYDQSYGGSGQEELRYLQRSTDGGFVLGGRSTSGISGDRTQPSQGGTDYWLVKVAPVTSSLVAARTATLPEANVPTKLTPLTAYPNPFQEQVSVRFSLPQTQRAIVKVLDSQGREIKTLFEQEAQAHQTYQVEWHAGKQAAGMYLLQLQYPGKIQHQKVLLSK